MEFFERGPCAVNGEPVGGLHLDFQKTFAKVLHQRLLCKIKAQAVGCNILAWIDGWLASVKKS